jgi:hypothetical protein
MGDIIVETPQGDVIVEIAGDAPTPEEEQAITQQFFSQQPTGAEIDLATASKSEILDYARQRRLAGVDPVSGERLTEDEYVSNYKEPGVDYRTGVGSVAGFSRFQFGRMDDSEEKSNYLKTVVGEEGFRLDPLGRHILTQDGRTKLGLGEGRELAIDEEGFSFNDVKEFAGATALPIIAGVGAGVAASGVGFLPGMFIVGAATAGGKLLDEGIEYAEGLQRQSFADVARDAAYEGVFGAAGEGIGRGISNLFGYFIKGPRGLTAAGKAENEAIRKQFRDLLDKDFRPTIAGGAGDSFRPILTRVQAVAEGVFPNRAAAQANADVAVKELAALGVDKSRVTKLAEVLNRDIDEYYASTQNVFANAQRHLNEATEQEIKQAMGALKNNEIIPADLSEMIAIRKRIFDEDMDRIYTKVNETLKNNEIIPTKGIKEALKKLDKQTIADIGATKFAKRIDDLGEFATARDVASIRTGLTDAQKNPSLLNDVAAYQLGSIKGAVNQAMQSAELDLASSVLKGSAVLKASGQSFEELSEGLNTLARANTVYRDGMKRFDNLTVQEIIKSARNNRLNKNFVYQNLILDNQPEALEELFKAIRGVDTGKALGAETGLVDLDAGARALSKATYGERPLMQALEEARRLPPESQQRRAVERYARSIEEEVANRTAIRGTGAEQAEQVRQGLAKMYLTDAIEQSKLVDDLTGVEVIDGTMLAANIMSKNKAVDKLLKPELGEIKEIVDILKRSKAKVASNVVDELQDRPLKAALNSFKQAQKEFSAPDTAQLTRILQSTNDPDVLASNIFSTVDNVKLAERVLAPETMEQVRDAAAGRILRQIGGTTEEVVQDASGAMVKQIKLSDDFIEKFKTGKVGNKLSTVLDSYEPKVINAMFKDPQAYESLSTLAQNMTKASNQAMAGKGGLAAPTIALGLTVGAFMLNPLAALVPAAGYLAMSKMLRNPKILRMMFKSRQQNSVKEFLQGKIVTGDPYGQGFQAALQIAGAATVQGSRMSIEQGAEEARPVTAAAKQQLAPVANQALQTAQTAMTQAPNVMPGGAGTVGQVSPILLPDPATAALAQSLGRTTP